MVEAPDECFLENVFCFVAGSHPPLKERQKARVVVHQRLQHLGYRRVALDHLDGSRARAVICAYSHPHPQPQPPSPHGHSAPQAQSQPQGHSLGSFSRFRILLSFRYGSGPFAVFIPANAPGVGILHLSTLHLLLYGVVCAVEEISKQQRTRS